MPDVKISAGADPVTLVSTDKVPMARSASTTAYAATMAELATYANGSYTPNYYTGTPSMDATGAAGTAAFVSRGDHVHPSDTTRVAKGGDTMTGLLTLSGAPTANLHAATKLYVDGSAPVGGPYVAIANLHDVGRNLLHNPLFNVAQRGAGPWSVGGYTADRWQASTVLDGIGFSLSAIGDTGRGQIGDEAAITYLGNTFTGNAGATAQNYLDQHIEGVRRLAGKTVTVSFWAVSAGTIKLGINAFQVFGTGGSPSAAVIVLATGIAVTTSTTWTRYSATIAIPSSTGKTLGTNNDDYTALRFYYSSGANTNTVAGNIGVQSGTINLWGVQLEIGSVATPLEKPDPRYDLANCQRFFCSGGLRIGGYLSAGGQALGFAQTLPATMRAIPTITPNWPTQSNATGNTAAVDASTFYAYAVATAAGSVVCQGSYIASADL